jgi:glycosyltransferase involved in cell wall biosynthesis
MPVYNGGQFLKKALDGLDRQSFKDFEILIIDDGSTDNTSEILSTVIDPRVRIIHKEHEGLTEALNIGLEQARGDYIARQDVDDYPKKKRLEKQYSYLKKNPDIILIGSNYHYSDLNFKILDTVRMPATDLEIKWYGIFQNPFAHSSVMFRKDIIQQNGGYSTDLNALYVEDYELWIRLMRKNFQFSNLQEPLIYHAVHIDSISENKKKEQNENFRQLINRSMDFFGVNLGINKRILDVIWMLQVGSGQQAQISEVEQALIILSKMEGQFANYYHLKPEDVKKIQKYSSIRTANTLVHSTLSQLRHSHSGNIKESTRLAMRLFPKVVFSPDFWRIKIKTYLND